MTKWLLSCLLCLCFSFSVLADSPVEIAARYVGQTETDGFNRSPFIDKINTFANAPLGSPYCASFVSWVFHEAGKTNAPVSAWSPDWFRKNLVAFQNIQEGDVMGLYFPSKKRIAHVGLVEGKQGGFIRTMEANTQAEAADLSPKSREGDGIFRRLRPNALLKDSRNKFARY